MTQWSVLLYLVCVLHIQMHARAIVCRSRKLDVWLTSESDAVSILHLMMIRAM